MPRQGLGLFWALGGHSYLDYRLFQKGTDDGTGRTVSDYSMTRCQDYANTDYVELIVPWDMALEQKLMIDVLSVLIDQSGSEYILSLKGAIEDD